MDLVSVIVCTRNRATSLQKTLATIATCELSSNYDVELLVVDNGSSDGTHTAFSSVAFSNLRAKYIYEPKQGKGHAYNLGLMQAKGEVFLFTDDDVCVGPRWIDQMSNPIRRGLCDAVQGPVKTYLSESTPDWFDRAAIGGVAEVDYGYKTLTETTRELVGANMAFSRKVVDTIGGFNTLLGPGRTGFFDDTEFSWRMAAAGFKTMYCPDAVVDHFPLASRMTRKSLRNEWFRHGVSAYVAFRYKEVTSPTHSTYRLARQAIRCCKLRILDYIARRAYRTTKDEMFLWMQLGGAWAYFNGLKRIAAGMGESVEQPPRIYDT